MLIGVDIVIKHEILDFYLKTSIYTNYEPFKDYFKNLSDDIYELAGLVNSQTIHRGTLIRSYYQKTNIAKEYPCIGIDVKMIYY